MRQQIQIIVCLLGLATAFPQQFQQQQFVPQQQQQVHQHQPQFSQNSYLPQLTASLQGQGGQGAFVPAQNQARFVPQQQQQNQEILNLNPPGLLEGQQVQQSLQQEVPQTQSLQGGQQDSYAAFRQLQLDGVGPGTVTSALGVNQGPNEYGETVPGQFSQLNSYAAYQNYQN